MDDWLTDIPDDSNCPPPKREGQIRVMQRKADPALNGKIPSTDTYVTADQTAARQRERQQEYNLARRRIFGSTPKAPLNSNNADLRDRGIRDKQNNGNVPESGRMRPKASFVNKNDAADPDYDRSRFVVKSPTSTTENWRQDCI